MRRKDYLMRQIEALTLVLAKILGLKQSGDYAGALVEVRSECRRLTGMDPETMISLSDETLLSLFTADGIIDTGKGLVVAKLLGEQGELHRLQGRGDAAYKSLRKALTLFLEILIYDDRLQTERYRQEIDALLARLGETGFPPSVQHRLFRYYEAVGEYGHAEDALYALREADHPGSAEEADAFYRRLLGKSDDALIAGGLPRDEVEEGLAGL